ncbi:MAG: DUF1351 domain-containing protein [Treponema sp.]|nr:DUF1351 domain-containing protein [Treponema sp.]
MEENNELIEEAIVVEEKTLVKPVFEDEINAKIVGIGKIEDNIKDVKEYAISLNEYYKNIKFTPETMDAAKDEKAKVNKFKDQVAEFRKQIVEKYNEPIKQFEDTAKETEELLKGTYELINNQCAEYDKQRKQEIENKLKLYFEEYKTSKNIDGKYLSFEDLNIKVTLSYETEKGELTKKAKLEVNEKVDLISEQLETISTMQYSDEILVEFIKDKNLNRAIKDVNDRHVVLEQVKEQKVAKEEQKITDEQVIAKIDSLTAPKVEETAAQEELLELSFKVRGTKDELIKVINYLENEGLSYEQC